MTKEELKALGLTDDQADKVIKGYEGYVPKARFDEVNEAKKQAEKNVSERDKQLEDLKKEKGDADALKSKISELQKQNDDAKKEYDQKIAELQMDAAIKSAITNAQDIELVAKCIDRSKLVMGADGKVSGLTEQVDALKKDKAFLFKTDQQQYNPQGGKPIEKNPFAKDSFNLTEQSRLIRDNPEQAKAYANAVGITLNI